MPRESSNVLHTIRVLYKMPEHLDLMDLQDLSTTLNDTFASETCREIFAQKLRLHGAMSALGVMYENGDYLEIVAQTDVDKNVTIIRDWIMNAVLAHFSEILYPDSGNRA